GISGLVVQGQPVEAAPGVSVPLGWGHLTLLGEGTDTGAADAPSFHATVTALDVVLDSDHGGLPPGTEIFVRRAEAVATVQPDLPPPPAATVAPEPPPPETVPPAPPPAPLNPPVVEPPPAPAPAPPPAPEAKAKPAPRPKVQVAPRAGPRAKTKTESRP